MRYVSHCAANTRAFNADTKLSMLNIGSGTLVTSIQMTRPVMKSIRRRKLAAMV